jgi:hypothetical protein
MDGRASKAATANHFFIVSSFRVHALRGAYPSRREGPEA